MDLFEWLGDLVKSIFSALWSLLTDIFCWLFDSFLSLCASIIGAFDFSGLGNLSPSVAGLGADILNMLGLVGLGYALGIIVSALVIRFFLQLIPFVRLGS